MQAAVLLDEVDNVLDPFTYAVADDQQQELAPSEVAGDVVDELRLIHLGAGVANQFIEHVARPCQGPGDLALKVLVAPGGNLPGVVEYLSDDFPACLWIAPELEFDQGQATKGVDIERVQITGGSEQLPTHGNDAIIGFVDGGDRQGPRMPEQQVRQGGFVHPSLGDGGVQGDPAQGFLGVTTVAVEPDHVSVCIVGHANLQGSP